MDVRHRPAGVVSANHRVVASDRLGHLASVLCVGGDHGHAFARRELAGVAGQHSHAVAALQKFIEHGGADKAGGTNQSDVHTVSLGSKLRWSENRSLSKRRVEG